MRSIHFALLMWRYQQMHRIKDNHLHWLSASITFRFGFFANTESTSSGLYLIYWHGVRSFGGPLRFVRLSFGTWCTLDGDDDGHYLMTAREQNLSDNKFVMWTDRHFATLFSQAWKWKLKWSILCRYRKSSEKALSISEERRCDLKSNWWLSCYLLSDMQCKAM